MLSSLMKSIMGKTGICSSTSIATVVSSGSPQTQSPNVNGRHREESNKMLSCRPDDIAICRQLGHVSDEELSVRAERKARNQLPGDLGKYRLQFLCRLNEFSR